SGAWALIPPPDDWARVMAENGKDVIADLWNRGIWQVNLRRESPETGEAAPPGWTATLHFLPPDLQVTKLTSGTARVGKQATASAEFYNHSAVGGTTKVYLYQVFKDGRTALLKEQEVYLGPSGAATLSADWTMTQDTAAIAASIARPYENGNWGYGHFTASNDLFRLEGYAVETGSGAYPPEVADLLKQKWANNVKQVEVKPQAVDIAVTASTTMPKYIIPFYSNNPVKCTVNFVVTRKDNGDPVPVRVTVESPLGSRTFDATLKPGGTWKNYVSYTVSKAGTYPVKVQAWPVGVEDVNPKDNTASLNIVVEKQKPPEVPRESKIHSELIGN
ncbi:MAG: hypothetical protein QHH75_10215, partial [Bacillota bacterium]|nr:hypothetical protein [Bacillota bacterium]